MSDAAYFAAGCFWGVEAGFAELAGVESTAVGYMGGAVKSPTYEQVCCGDTEHAEAVRVIFDESRISYTALLDFFWTCHDPSQLNRQGADVGRQYRSAIFCADDAQLTAAVASKADLERQGKKIATELIPPSAPTFWLAEDYHQNYFAKSRKGA